jgi:glycosyl hydrolase family 106( putative alpha-L-rhamnosidase)
MRPSRSSSTVGRMAALIALVLVPLSPTARGDETWDEMRNRFFAPPIDCRPHTRWWWMGNATTKENLTWELQQMHARGMGGVEQITMEQVYQKGNHPYLSDEYLELVVHAIAAAKKLGMEFSLNFGGPGWVIGGDWVPPHQRSQNMLASALELVGPKKFSGSLSTRAVLNSRDVPRSRPDIWPDDRLVAVVAGRIEEGRIRESTLVEITDHVRDRLLTWEVPPGQWRVMSFWLTYTKQGGAVDHFSKSAMQHYCDTLGGIFQRAFGDEFGKTVDSFFCDSFEVAIFRNGIYWSDGLLAEFESNMGYNLVRYLPAVWWEVDELSPKIRYDVNQFLHDTGREAFFDTFLDWCQKHGVKGRIQPYGFTTDILQGAGMAHLPEMEVTAGEKDAVPWFDTRIGPKKYVASGAHLYGRNMVTVEAYTYLHWEPFRATLEELKIASDVYLRCGANKFYNHGYTSSLERDPAPSRRFGAEMLISPPNVWWPYYRHLSDYIARCSYLLRQGHFTADVAIYSPLANQWTRDALNARKWTRDFDWGGLGKLLVGAGYDFDLINDQIMQQSCRFEDGSIHVRDLEYKILILPNIESLPLATLERVEEYVRQGGVVIALERLPRFSTGFHDYANRDRAVRALAGKLFQMPQGRDGTGRQKVGQGCTYCIERVIDRSDVLDRRSTALDPFIQTLHRHIRPDFGIDFAREGLRENGGLTFVHRRLNDVDIYFVTNIQDRAIQMPVTFRVELKVPWRWNPYDGSVTRVHQYRAAPGGTELALRLAPYESTFLLFQPSPHAGGHVVASDLDQIVEVTADAVEALARRNGGHQLLVDRGGQVVRRSVVVSALPAALAIGGEWKLTLEGSDFPKLEKKMFQLSSWTDDPDTRHFSGTGRYQIEFDLPDAYLAEQLSLTLDLGAVGAVAEVHLNGQPVGTRWMRGQGLDISGKVRSGENHLVLLVTNTLINRVSGWTEPPPVPESLIARYGGDAHAAGARAPIGFGPLPASGLLGPVTIIPRAKINVPFD